MENCKICEAIEIEKGENTITCPECHGVFCDNCYDTELGDGCHCHG